MQLMRDQDSLYGGNAAQGTDQTERHIMRDVMLSDVIGRLRGRGDDLNAPI